MREGEKKEKHQAYMRDYMRRRRAAAALERAKTVAAVPVCDVAPVSVGRSAVEHMLREAVMNTQRMTPPAED